MRCAFVFVLVLAACGVEIDPSEHASIDGYQQWQRQVTVLGNAPGHSNSYRIIYVNDIAAGAADLTGGYPDGSVIVKEIFDLVDGNRPGDLRYLGIMRREGAFAGALQDEGGWLYTDQRDGVETYYAFCWARCHVAAPYNGAWYDYRD
jgi:hypothetical protein